MTWQSSVMAAEAMLNDSRIPSSTEIITLIKKVNPTGLQLAEPEKERAYHIKGKLQSLLLEHYGNAFYLAPHPYSQDIILIKHTALPSIDACHAELKSLSVKALQAFGEFHPQAPEKNHPKGRRKTRSTEGAASGSSPRETFRKGQLLLEAYEYAEAAQVLAGIRIDSAAEVDTLEKSVRLLVEEMGEYERGIETVLAQPKRVLREARIRELLALAYYRNASLPEARAIFDSLAEGELGKEALFAYAEICFKDGNHSLAFHLLGIADEREGYVGDFTHLRKRVEEGLLEEAEPVVQQAVEALERGDYPDAESLARKALEHHPNHPKAREILEVAGATRETAEITRLWERFAQAERREVKIDLLARLMECDREQTGRIRELLAAEKAARKKELVAARVAELHVLAREGSWCDCYAIVHWLSGQEDEGDSYREACAISPYLRVLYQNRRLQRLPEKTSREIWLDFVKAKALLLSGKQQEPFEIMERIREYFQSYPEFSEDYLTLAGREQERARDETRRLMVQAEAEDCPRSRAERIFRRVRRAMVPLPREERREYERSMEARLALFPPEQTEDLLVEVYQEALLFGNTEKAALLREEISDKGVLEEFEAEVAELFKVESEPVSLALSRDLPVDLTREPPLTWRFATDRHIVFLDGEESVVVANLAEMSATRFVAPAFKNLAFCDAIPERDTFLLRDITNHGTAWRAVLSPGRGAFTAVFDVNGEFGVEESEEIAGMYLSSDKATDYFATIYHKQGLRPARLVRQRLGSRNTICGSINIGTNPFLFTYRLSCDPDRFLVGTHEETKGTTKICNKKLLADLSVRVRPQVWQVDPAKGHIYMIYSHYLTRTNFELNTWEDYPLSQCLLFWEGHVAEALCPGTATVLLRFGEKAAFYNYDTNKLCTPFRRGNVVATKPAGKWFYFDYARETRTLTLRDVTGEIDTIVEWENFDITGIETNNEDDLMRLHKQLYFGYPPTDGSTE